MKLLLGVCSLSLLLLGCSHSSTFADEDASSDADDDLRSAEPSYNTAPSGKDPNTEGQSDLAWNNEYGPGWEWDAAVDGPIEEPVSEFDNTLGWMEDAMVGKWEGTVTNQWNGTRPVYVEFRADGGYSAYCYSADDSRAAM